MLEITNRQKGPIQLMVRSKKKLDSFSTLAIPGIGAGRNVVLIEDERVTDHINFVEHELKLISTRFVQEK